MTTGLPKAPNGLGTAGKALWRTVVAAYDLSPAELEILRQAARTSDLIDRMEKALTEQPMAVAGSTGQLRSNPLLASVAEQRRTLDGLIRSLALPMPDESEGARKSPQQVAAAQARWVAQKQQRKGA